MSRPTLGLARKTFSELFRSSSAVAARQFHSSPISAASSKKPSHNFILVGRDHRDFEVNMAQIELLMKLWREKYIDKRNCSVWIEKINEDVSEELRKSIPKRLSAKELTDIVNLNHPESQTLEIVLRRSRLIEAMNYAMWRNSRDETGIRIMELDDPAVGERRRKEYQDAIARGTHIGDRSKIVASYEKERLGHMAQKLLNFNFQNPEIEHFFISAGMGHLLTLPRELQNAFPQAKILCVSGLSQQGHSEVLRGRNDNDSAEEIMRYMEIEAFQNAHMAGLGYRLQDFKERNRVEILPHFGQSIPQFSKALQDEVTEMVSGKAITLEPDSRAGESSTDDVPLSKEEAKKAEELSSLTPNILVIGISDHRDFMSNKAWISFFEKMIGHEVIKPSETVFFFETWGEKSDPERAQMMKFFAQKYKSPAHINNVLNDPTIAQNIHDQATIAETINEAFWRDFAAAARLEILTLESEKSADKNRETLFNDDAKNNPEVFRKNVAAREDERIVDMVANVTNRMQKDPKQNIVLFAGAAHTPALRYMLQKIFPSAKIKCALTASEQGINQSQKNKQGRTIPQCFEHVISRRNDYVQNETNYGDALKEHQEYGDILMNSGNNFVTFHESFVKEMADAFRSPSTSPSPKQAVKGQDDSQNNQTKRG